MGEAARPRDGGHWVCCSRFPLGLIVIVVVLARPRWVSRQRGAVKRAIGVAGGDVSGLWVKCKRRYGRRVCEILVWTWAPLLS